MNQRRPVNQLPAGLAYPPVAFRVDGHLPVVHTNDWSNTTGRHLAAIDGGSLAAKKNRVDAETFKRLWEAQTQHHQLTTKG